MLETKTMMPIGSSTTPPSVMNTGWYVKMSAGLRPPSLKMVYKMSVALARTKNRTSKGSTGSAMVRGGGGKCFADLMNEGEGPRRYEGPRQVLWLAALLDEGRLGSQTDRRQDSLVSPT